MHGTRLFIGGFLLLIACGASQTSSDTSGQKHEPAENEFQTQLSSTAGDAHGATASKIKATKTEAAMKFFVVDKVKKEPIAGIVISLSGPDGKKYYTKETDEAGYGEVLVPVGQAYDVSYLSLGRKDITAKVTVEDEPFQNVKLTLRYKPRVVEPPPTTATGEPDAPAPQPVFRLDGVVFDSNSAELSPDSFPRLDSVVEYMTYKESARIEVSGHTDNVGKAAKNKALSEARARACRDYLISKGIDGSRIEAVGYGDEKPVASNDTKEGQQKNRRIEARELE
jgi:outer membrane protein OmpA-like peptidoglycan-associated protein